MIQVVDGVVNVDGETLTGQQLRDRLGSDADLVLQVSYLSSQQQRELAGRTVTLYPLFHPAAALRSTDVERQSYDDIAGLPRVLTEARARRASARTGAPVAEATPEPTIALAAASAGDDLGDDAPTLF